MASSASVTLTRVIGSKCDFPWECHTRVSRSYCSYRSVCECLYGFYYDKESDSCYRPKNYGEKCDPSNILEGCRNEHLVCAEYGSCICHPGLHFDPAQIPFCQPNNSTKCSNGDIWDGLRNRCVHFKPAWTEGGIYERNRYSLFFAIVLVLTVMIILFKSKWSSSNPFVVGSTSSGYTRRHRRSTHRGSRDSRISFPETSLIPESRLTEYYGPVFRSLIMGRYSGCHVQCDFNENYNPCYPATCDRREPTEVVCNYHPPPPYSSTCNLATTGLSGSQFMVDKPPPYEEGCDCGFPDPCPRGQVRCPGGQVRCPGGQVSGATESSPVVETESSPVVEIPTDEIQAGDSPDPSTGQGDSTTMETQVTVEVEEVTVETQVPVEVEEVPVEVEEVTVEVEADQLEVTSVKNISNGEESF